jgi:molecular chaperone GrpE (heat shock protein)
MAFLKAMAFSYEERLTIIEEKHSLETEQRIDELKQQILSLQQAYRRLAEELEQMQARHQQSHWKQERERIVEGLQHMRKILEERAASSE